MILTANNVSKNYGDKKLLENVTLYINEGDKIGVIGINGTGKSTLLKILADVEDSDSGEIIKKQGDRVIYLPQNPVFNENLTVIEQVFFNTSNEVKNLKEYEAKTILTKLGMTDFDKRVSLLSGGQRKRVAIASALVNSCELLILDEPTNHLDNDMVVWLEGYLKKFNGAIIMVTHDRYFLDRVTNKIIELDKGNLYTYDGNYNKFIELKAMREDFDEASERKRQSVLRKELEWIKRGVRARGTKSKSRIERFEELRDKPLIQVNDKVDLSSVSSRLGKKIIEINNISKSFSDKNIVENFEFTITKDARIGIVGQNGAGKTTFLNLISGRLKPDSGNVEIGQTVKLGYFSQESKEMDLKLKVIDYIKNIAEYIETIDGKISASQMLEKFLFTPDLQYNVIGRLSGGERRRLFLLSILVSAPNVLLLDEPTNDLDIQTLTILEDYLETFKGAVITVSHDRYFLDKVVNAIFEVQGNGIIKLYNGGYSDFHEEKELIQKTTQIDVNVKDEKRSKQEYQQKPKKLKFTFKEQREYETIDDDISMLEEKIEDIGKQMSKNSTDYVKLQDLMNEKDKLQVQLDFKMDRWVYLSDLKEQIENQKNI
ncbi:ABC-F family ATP-binding cassette domain-containing protein [Sedimentibacter sp. zth1]|uniref:ABC-F family ATP-binding cassette domain-containing protein n=1 Tax=Sedimentibacter sp. zth1 TaxID=2816908 RepID=UPI001A927901|nr:ABC-F family ATP-binding cassette domain-containing protein [Sedimentibacter sp. zth1]QSX04849.1 ABC-F family ATP-binding cassette domain-containing protein [Sedimentibacter sp. zth1]